MQGAADSGKVPDAHKRFGGIAKVMPPANSAIWALLDQATVSGTTFLTSILVARVLGSEEFGRFALGLAIVSIAQNVHGALLTGPLMTLGPSRPSAERPAYLGAILTQQAAFTVASMSLCWTILRIVDAIKPSWQFGLLAAPVALFIGVGTISELWRHFFFATSESRTSASVDLLRYGTQFILVAIYLTHQDPNVSGVFFAMAAAASLAAVCGWLASSSRATWSPLVARQVIHEHWQLARWLLVSTGTGSAREAIVSFATAAMLGLTETGLLRAAQQLVLAINVPLQGLGKIAQAQASLAFVNSGIDGLKQFMRRFVRTYLVAIALVLVAIALAGEGLITLAYGHAYTGAGYLLSAYAIVMLAYLCREALTLEVRAMRMPVWETWSCVAGAAASLALLYPLIKVFGAGGAIAAEAVFNVVTVAGLLYLSRSSRFRRP